jgi:surface protein
MFSISVTISLIISNSFSFASFNTVKDFKIYPLSKTATGETRGGLIKDSVAMKDGIGTIVISSISTDTNTINNKDFNDLLKDNKDDLIDINLKDIITVQTVADKTNDNKFVDSGGTVPQTHTPGESCNDLNAATSDDVYLADGVTCQGVNNSGIYLSSNGITIKCENAAVGTSSTATGDTSGINYLVVEDGTGTYGIFNSTIRNNIISGVLKVCTSHVYTFNQTHSWDGGLFFNETAFNQDISSWDTSNVNNMTYMFYQATNFNQSIGNWNTANVDDMCSMFIYASSFNNGCASGVTNCPLNWNTSKVTNMYKMFTGAAKFNQPIDSWDTSKVTNMSAMFNWARVFNQPLNSWDVSKVTNMSSMFSWNLAFNQPLNSWKVSNVTNMNRMFQSTTAFNQNISSWDTQKVIDMSSLFYGASSFNVNISSWNVSSVTDMNNMFYNASVFNQNISIWCPKTSVTHFNFENGPLIPSYYPKANNWSSTNCTDGYYNSPTP